MPKELSNVPRNQKNQSNLNKNIKTMGLIDIQGKIPTEVTLADTNDNILVLPVTVAAYRKHSGGDITGMIAKIKVTNTASASNLKFNAFGPAADSDATSSCRA